MLCYGADQRFFFFFGWHLEHDSHADIFIHAIFILRLRPRSRAKLGMVSRLLVYFLTSRIPPTSNLRHFLSIFFLDPSIPSASLLSQCTTFLSHYNITYANPMGYPIPIVFFIICKISMTRSTPSQPPTPARYIVLTCQCASRFSQPLHNAYP